MQPYKIIGVAANDIPVYDLINFSVAYHNNMTGDDAYFLCQINKNYHSDLTQILTQHAYEVGGVHLAGSLKDYIKWTKEPWGASMKFEYVVVPESFDWSGYDPTAPISPIKIGNKMKITVEGGVTPKFIKKHEYASGGQVDHTFHELSESASHLPRGLSQLPGLAAIVNHPGDQDHQSCIYMQEAQLQQMIIHLNDRHKWTRERIADWLDEISDPTGETGPDLRFGAEPAKVNPPQEMIGGFESYYDFDIASVVTKNAKIYSEKIDDMHIEANSDYMKMKSKGFDPKLF